MTRKIAGLESDLNLQQQKNVSLEKQLGEAESKIKQVRGRFHFMRTSVEWCFSKYKVIDYLAWTRANP